MNQNRDFYAGLVATVFFAVILFVLIPIYVKVPSFIPGFAPPPDMWPRVVAVIGLVMGVLALVLAFPKMREASRNQVEGLGSRFCSGDGVVAWRAVHHDGQFRTQILDDRPFDHLPGLAVSAVYQGHAHALPRRQAVVFQPF